MILVPFHEETNTLSLPSTNSTTFITWSNRFENMCNLYSVSMSLLASIFKTNIMLVVDLVQHPCTSLSLLTIHMIVQLLLA